MTLNDLIENKNIKMLLFGGKGGVGKTTCAASTSVFAAENLNKKVLVISTDPAHSLGDSLGQVLTPGEVTKVNDVKNLWALEISPEMEQSQVSNMLSMIPQEDFPLGDEMKDLTQLNPPGIDEAMAFGKVLEYIDNSDYDLIIFDTAPTGHTLRLLSIPQMLSGWMGKIITLRLKMGKIFEMFKGLLKKKSDDDKEEEDPLDTLKKLKESIESANLSLTNPEKTSFIICTIAEIMSIYETERLISSLIEYNIPSNHILINQLYPEHLDCKFCQVRRQMQQNHVKNIRELFGKNYNITELPLFDNEVRNIDKLRLFAKYLFE